MRFRFLLASVFVLVELVGVGCKKAPPPPSDSAYVHTPGQTYKQIEGLRLELVEAMQKKELQDIHDNMFYFRGLLKSLSGQLEGEKKQEVDKVLRDLEELAEAIDNSAGRGNQAATESNLQKLIDRLQELETFFKEGKK